MGSLSLAVFPERRALASTGRQRLFVAVELEAEGPSVEGARPPLSCVLAIDASGSMAGPPIEQVVLSVDRLLELAAPTDRLGLVAFSDGATVVSPLTFVDEAGRRVLARRAHRLGAQGWTNLEAGLRAASAMLFAEGEERRRSILLLSDGAPNRGASTSHELREVVKAFRPAYSVSTLGYGPQHQEDVLSAIADTGGGRYQFVQDPALARHELALALGAQADVVVSGLELVFSPAAGVDLVRFVGVFDLRYREGGALVALSDMEDRARRLVVLELDVRDVPASGRLASLALSYTDARSREARDVRVDVDVDLRATASAPDPEASARILLGRAEEERAKARAFADRGQFEGAAAVLRAFLREVEASPAYAAGDGSDLWEAHELVLDEANALERRPDQEAYSVFRKQTMHVKVDTVAPSVASLRRSRGITSITQGRSVGPVPVAVLVVEAGPEIGKRHAVGERCTIGRTGAAEILIASPQVSRRHAEVFALEGDHWICDLASTNPTVVNGAVLGSMPHKLAAGDRIAMGDVRLRYELGSP